MKKITLVTLAVIVIFFAAAVYFYPAMPDKMASHWGLDGTANGYSDKAVGLFAIPLLSLAIVIIFWIVPIIDPLKENIQKFRQYYDKFILIFLGFMLYLFSITIAWNLGYQFDMMVLLAPAFGFLFYYIGILTENAKRNWFIGIRTPWTLSSEKVWEKTHKIGGRLFKVSGALVFLGIIFRSYMIFFIIVPVILTAIYTVIYSFMEYRMEKAVAKKRK